MNTSCTVRLIEPVTSEERSVITLYRQNTQCFANRLNEALLNGSQTIEEDVSLLDSVTKKFECLKKITLYRATSIQDFRGMDLINGGLYINPQFMSCSNDIRVLPKFFTHSHPVLLIITCPAHTRMADMSISHNPSESEGELLLGRNNTFKIAKRLEHKASSREGLERMIQVMERDRVIGVSELLELHLTIQGPSE